MNFLRFWLVKNLEVGIAEVPGPGPGPGARPRGPGAQPRGPAPRPRGPGSPAPRSR